MHRHETSITLNDLIYAVIPNLNSAEKLVFSTLDSLIEEATTPLIYLNALNSVRHLGWKFTGLGLI